MFPQPPEWTYTTEEFRNLCWRVEDAVPAVSLGHLHAKISTVMALPGTPIPPTNRRRNGTHQHPHYEALIVLTGSAQYNIGSPVRPGSTLLFSPGVWHGMHVLELPYTRLGFAFTLEPLAPIAPPPCWPVSTEALWDLMLLMREAEQAAPGWRNRATAYMSALLLRILSLMGCGFPEDQPSATMSLTERMDSYLRDHLTERLTLQELEEVFQVSSRTVNRHFTSELGKSMTARLLDLRMDRARRLLQCTTLTISQIGEQVGIPECAYFCRCFRRHYQLSPQQYRIQVHGVLQTPG